MSDAHNPPTASVMSSHELPADARQGDRLALEPMDPQLTSIQPGGGFIVKLELAWGRWRRWFLRTFRGGYVSRMHEKRRGEVNGCPHEPLDPRDLKYYRNQDGYYWEPHDDPFAWRDRLPFARAGLAELIVFSLITFAPAAVLGWMATTSSWPGWLSGVAWLAVAAICVIGLLIVWFFRDPKRAIPIGDDVVVSPADGKVVTIEEIEDHEFLEGRAVLIGIFLSIFNVHINRMPIAGRVIGLRYKPGKCLNALRPESARENEHLAVRIEGASAPHHRMIVRQITGAIARRIVCWLKPGDELCKGDQFGMIKLGSRTELVLPLQEELKIRVSVGDTVRAGSSVMAEYVPSEKNAAADSEES